MSTAAKSVPPIPRDNAVSDEDRRELEAAREEKRLPKTSVVELGVAAMDEYDDVFARLAK